MCVTSPSVLQPDKQEDGTVTGKDRWRQKLLSAMAAGIPVTPSSLVPSPLSFSSSCFLFSFFFSPHLSLLCRPQSVCPSLPVPSSGFYSLNSGTCFQELLIFSFFIHQYFYYQPSQGNIFSYFSGTQSITDKCFG